MYFSFVTHIVYNVTVRLIYIEALIWIRVHTKDTKVEGVGLLCQQNPA